MWVWTLSIAKINWCLDQMIKNNHHNGDVNRLKFIFAVKKKKKKKKSGLNRLNFNDWCHGNSVNLPKSWCIRHSVRKNIKIELVDKSSTRKNLKDEMVVKCSTRKKLYYSYKHRNNSYSTTISKTIQETYGFKINSLDFRNYIHCKLFFKIFFPYITTE